MERGFFMQQIAPWLRLTLAPGIGPVTAHALVARYHSAAKVLEQPFDVLAAQIGAGKARALLRSIAATDAALEKHWHWLQGAPAWDSGLPVARAIWVWDDPQYPPWLKELNDAPVVLHVVGAARWCARTATQESGTYWHEEVTGRVAVVGSRSPTQQGVENARLLARQMQEMGIVIVSGMALGIDAAAHWGALENASGLGPATLAVMGTGVDCIYPSRHLDLARKIAQQGIIISEQPLGTPAQAHNFPRRNRIITGCTQGTLVVEAALKSGSLISARLAAEQGREVFAIPGSIHAPQSKGCNMLIKQGAKLVESAQDILEELPAIRQQALVMRNVVLAEDGAQASASALSKAPASAALNTESSAASVAAPVPATQAMQRRPASMPPPTPASVSAPPLTSVLQPMRPFADNALLDAIGFDPVSLDYLESRTGIATAVLQVKLLELELLGEVERLPGGIFQRLMKG